MMVENHQKQEPGQADEKGAQIQLGYEILRLISLCIVCSCFLDVEPQIISLPGSRLRMGQAPPGHLGVECKFGFFKQVSAIAGNMQEFIIAQACVLLVEVRVQDSSTPYRLTRGHMFVCP